MMGYFKKYTFLSISLLFLLLVATACGSSSQTEEDKKSENKNGVEETNKEQTLEDAMGKVTIPANPNRIIAPYLEDSMIALGVKPAAQWSIGDTVLDYLQPELKGIPKIGWDLPLEQAVSNDPDLIIFSSPAAIQKGQYDEYKKIAPTYVFKEEVNADWRKQLTQMGEILNKQKEAKDALSNYDSKVAEAKAKLQDTIGDQTVAIIWVAGDQFYLFENNRFSAKVLYNDLGIKQPEFIKTLPEAAAQWNPITLEKLPEIKADHLFLLSKKGEVGLDILAKSSLWNGIDAVKNGKVYEMNDPSNWTINGLIASEKTVDQVVNSLTK